jgi:sterol desaturase/sphingolipid hydroxylase (fatty acid hydroxylase superfamily)
MGKKLYVSNKDETVRMFKNDFLERLSRVHFTVPLFIFIPVILWHLYRSVFIFQLPVLTIIGMLAGGVVVWTLVEYLLHRFVFHLELPGKIGQRIHFIFHGVHHDYPSDSKRLVMVPAVSIPLAILFYYLFRWMLSAELVAPFFSGFVTGYLCYDMIHYAVHHFNLKSRFWLELKHHHMLHHFRENDRGFGVSSKFWDLVFRTTFRRIKSS